MPLETFVKHIAQDAKGFYHNGKGLTGPNGEKLSTIEHFASVAEENGLVPETEVEKAEVEAQFISLCERINLKPHEHRKRAMARKLVEDSYAMWLVFKEAKIDPFDEYAPRVDQIKNIKSKAFGVSSVQNVFPVFYDNQIMEGILATAPLDSLVAQTVQVTSGTADHVGLTDTTTHRRSVETGEWAKFAEVSLSYTNAVIALHKYGSNLKISDEAARRSRLPVFAAALRRVGQQLAIDVFDYALDTLIAGDGTTLGGAAGTLAATGNVYNDLVDLIGTFNQGYMPTDMLATWTVLADILKAAEFKDPEAGFSFARTGQLMSPLGWTMHRWDSTGASNYATTKLVVWQRDLALVQYQEGGIQSETDRIIENQFSQTVTSWYVGFGIWDREAATVGTGW